MTHPPIISIDAASKCLGWAVMANHDRMLDCGLIRQNDKAADETPFDRIDRIVVELREVVAKAAKEHGVKTAVLEITSGKQAGRMRGRMAGLATLGGAIATVRSALIACGLEVHLVKENEWTRRRPKPQRAAYIHDKFRNVDWSKDKGMDVADAVGLGVHWWTVRELRGAA